MAYQFAKLAPEYANLWRGMTINASRVQGFNVAARKLLGRISRYAPVSEATGVPEAVIAVIHERESSGDFRTHLHNGDPLTARTFHVPAGRPKTGSPPFVWEFSAIDALRYQGLDKIDDWSLERALFVLEGFNGFGYRNKGLRSPYLWGGTNQQQPGKYVRDGVFDPGAIDSQPGCAPLLYALFQMDRSLTLRLSGAPAMLPEPDIPPPRRVDPPATQPPPEPPPRPPVSPAQQGIIGAAIAAILAGFLFARDQIVGFFQHLFGG